jgi:8-oxo-dGTP diphosphatase
MSRVPNNIAVSDIILRRGNKVLFLLRKNTGWRDGQYCLPGGHVEDGESFKQSACRELLEEVGIKVTPDQLEHRITFHAKSDRGDGVRVGVFFEAINWTGEPTNAEPDKHAEIAWFDLDDLPDTATPHTRKRLDEIKNSRHYIEYGWPV